jgi:hypothetical protein
MNALLKLAADGVVLLNPAERELVLRALFGATLVPLTPLRPL